MNLLQIQDRLKELPSDPRTMQLLTAYANGQNAAVPPYLALGELNRRKKLMEEQQQAAAGQAPQGTVKDQIEQRMGLMSLQQGQQQQAQQQMMQQQQGGPVPPQIAQQGPVQAARGGLLERLMSYPAARYRSGGIISFAGGTQGSVEDEITRQANVQDTAYAMSGSPEGMSSKELFNAFAKMLSGNVTPQRDETPRETRERMRREDPQRYAVLDKPIGETAMANLQALQEAQRAEIARQAEEAKRLQPGVLQQLGQAAMATRGRTGRDALAAILGGYADIASKTEAEAVKGEQARRAKELDMMQARFELQGKVEDLQRARADGDVKAENEALAKIAETARKHGLDVSKIIGEVAGRVATAEYQQGSLAADAETRAETRRKNLAQEALERNRQALDKRKLDEAGRERLALQIEQTLLKDRVYTMNDLQASILEQKPKLTPEEQKQLDAHKRIIGERRDAITSRVLQEAGGQGTKAGGAGSAKPTTILRFDAQGRPIK